MSSIRGAGRLNNFDTLRLIFAVLVIFSHSYPLGRGSNQTEPLSVLTHGLITLGSVSVWAFFVISGFLITQSWMRSPSPLKFLRRRVGRIYPGFIVAALFGGLVVVPLAADPHTYTPVSLPSFFWQTLRLQTFSCPPVFLHNANPNALNGSLWSVAFEFWCYIGVLFLGMTAVFRRRWMVLAIFAAVIAFHLCLDITGWIPGGGILGTIFGFPLYWAVVLPFFLAGSIFHLYGGATLLRRSWLVAAGILLIASNFIPHAYVITLPTCGAYLLFGLAYLPLLHPLNLGRYGDFSYGTYLYAYPIEQLIVMYGGGKMAPFKLFLIAAPIALCVGALSWFLVERHFLSRNSQLKHEGKENPRPEDVRIASSSPRPAPVETATPLPAERETYVEARL
ncbi:acyltransferase family protein [Paracidobacterium acidisoli]|uniref:Acyltransferase n=1 Tax=Paracidobacterium acidisoli TaxID=2303751 RepID=A0A372IR69_9BACT|nr:acyltransferase [Paracidobacterium acidisoli]MBT9330251.1 acyltransferase [Paracidobacterium acidisoli]